MHIMKPIKKCKHCGEWSEWSGGPEDLCSHCHHLLDKEASHASQVKHEIETKVKSVEEKSFYVIKPTDSMLMITVRRVAWAGYMVYVGIVAFFIWLVAFISG
jgi:hypothetical protein